MAERAGVKQSARAAAGRRVAALSLTLLVGGCGSWEERASPAEDLPPRAVLVGIDGAAWKIVGRGIGEGWLPTFARLQREGAYSRDLEVISPHSPIAWTSIATGRAPEDHGVTHYVSRLPNGDVIPVTSSERRQLALWEIASRTGRSAGVLGWWASWPAEEIRGYVVTDHANPAWRSFMSEDRRYWTVEPGTLAALKRDVQPPDLVPELEACWIQPDSFPEEDFSRRAQLSGEQMAVLLGEPWNQRTPYSMLKLGFSIDRPLVCAAERFLRSRPTDLVMLYLKGPDPIQHYAWDLVEPERYAVRPPQLDRDRGIVEAVYRYVDSFLADLLEAAPARTWFVIASDHGAEPNPGATGHVRSDRPGGHTGAAKGVLFLHGPQVRRGLQLEAASGYDVMPTLLWLLGLPISERLEGEVLETAFEADFVEGRPLRMVADYGAREAGPPLPSDIDASLAESLRSLGYIE